MFGSYSQTAFKERDFSKNSFGNMILSCFADRVDEGVVELKNCEIELIDEVDNLDIKQSDQIEDVKMYETLIFTGGVHKSEEIKGGKN